MEHEVRLASPREVPALARLLGEAFCDDAMLTWTYPRTRIEERARRFFWEFDRLTVQLGWLYAVGDREGVALWVPPDPAGEYERITVALDPLVRKLAGERFPLYDPFWAWIDGRRPSEPHYYLDHIAVDAKRRGEGLGVALVDHGLALAREAEVAAFLVTSRPDNIGFYERRGFTVSEDADAPEGGPHLWFMRRDP